ncbi:hypothetical protein AZI86_13040 [Bdellovibrio bacteriovorus]|uniref:Uncharacterized protein n=1 Tax=Bdellovibrio bacteriovorus TaxID=959 RepID=A0A150WJ82_BDEBC|nr:hypothetical protein [Bdellovibrio bacteriovorus]KYG63744.1 hypothetical protein AZI86_13040 [Bdellovibrio bacteriovorus]
MKIALLAITFLFTNAAAAAEFCQQIPDGISYDQISNNFDGSVYFKTPKVFVSGTYLPLRYSNGFCTLVNKKFVSAKLTRSSKDLYSVELDNQGNLVDIYKDANYIEWLICK